LTEVLNGSVGSTAEGWFYSQGGQRQSPVPAEQLRELLNARLIDGDTLVWRKGLTDWLPLRTTEIDASLGDTPPPIAAAHISNVLMWIVAIAPIPFAFINAFLVGMALAAGDDSGFLPVLGIVIQSTAMLALCLVDRFRLKRAGYTSGWLTLFAVICSPIYMFLRASHLRERPYYGFAAIGAFFLALFLRAL